MIPRVVEIKTLDDYKLWVRFQDGKSGSVDLSGELWGPMFEPLKDKKFFGKAEIHPELATVTWPNGADLAPEFLYRKVAEPVPLGSIGRNSIDAILRTAIAERRIVSFTLDGHHRIAEPHDYGITGGKKKLFVYQIGGRGRSGPSRGWRWAGLEKISKLKVLDQHFAGPRPAPSGRRVRWEKIFASVSRAPSQ
jgi:hypothetical protein